MTTRVIPSESRNRRPRGPRPDSLCDGPADPPMPGQVQGDDVRDRPGLELAPLALLEAVGVRYIMPAGVQR